MPIENDSVRTGPGCLVGGKELLRILFPIEADRPTERWLSNQRKARVVPFKKIGRLVWFDPIEVRQAFDQRFTIKAR